MATHRQGAEQLAAELGTLLAGMGLPIAHTADRGEAEGIVVTATGERDTTVEWFVSTVARQAAAAEQTEGRPEGRALVLHRTARAHLHQAVGAILQTLGYTVTQNRDGSLRIDGPAGATEGAQTSAELATSAGAGLDDLETLRARGDRGPRGGSDEDGDDGSAGVPARL